MSSILKIFKKGISSRNQKILVAGYPRSGNSWFNYVLTNTVGAKWLDIHKPDKEPEDPEERIRLGYGDEIPEYTTQYSWVIKSHNLREKLEDLDSYSRVIYLVRDPRDVAVSYFFFKYLRIPKLRGEESLDLNNKKVVEKLLDQHVRQVSREWKRHYHSWAGEKKHTVKYEDLKSNTKGEFIKVCKYIKVKPDPEHLDEVLEHYKFENMSKGRAEGLGKNDEFVRKGIVGDFRNHLSPEFISLIESTCGKEMKNLGYINGAS